jgi:hypothetical protein
MLKMKIKFLYPFFLQLKLYKISLHSLLIFDSFKSRFFLKLAPNTKFIKKQNKFYFVAKKFSFYTLINLKAFFFKLSFFFKLKKALFCKKIFLQGLGFKIISLVQNSFIELKLGYSHFVKIGIPAKKELTLFTNKNMIVIEGCEKGKVGNFANKIKSFRVPDNYKGKGI